MTLSSVDTSKWNFVGVAINGTTIKLYRGVGGTLTPNSTTTDTGILQTQSNARNLRAGGAHAPVGGGFDASMHIAAAAIHSVALSDAQMTQAYNFYKAKFDALGLAGL